MILRNTLGEHKPVMLDEVLSIIRPKADLKVIDFTFGRGGHSKELLRNGAEVYGLDRDLAAVNYAGRIRSENFKIFHSLFSEARQYLHSYRYFDCALFDFGLSSTQIEAEVNGMSFKRDFPLKMTMGKNKLSAYEVVNYFPEKELADIIYNYGEERASRKIAKKIIDIRKTKPISTTMELANLVRSVVFGGGKDPATRTFQAIRIFVNNEIEEIKLGLKNAQMLLKTGGLMVAISFHSMEDRVVKQFFKGFRYRSDVVFPSRAEVFANPRSRSAKLRFACVM